MPTSYQRPFIAFVVNSSTFPPCWTCCWCCSCCATLLTCSSLHRGTLTSSLTHRRKAVARRRRRPRRFRFNARRRRNAVIYLGKQMYNQAGHSSSDPTIGLLCWRYDANARQHRLLRVQDVVPALPASARVHFDFGLNRARLLLARSPGMPPRPDAVVPGPELPRYEPHLHSNLVLHGALTLHTTNNTATTITTTTTEAHSAKAAMASSWPQQQ